MEKTFLTVPLNGFESQILGDKELISVSAPYKSGRIQKFHPPKTGGPDNVFLQR